MHEYPGLPACWRGPLIQHWSADRAAVVGDVHGDLRTLEILLDQLDGRSLFFVGDLVDRGPQSAQVVEQVCAAGGRMVLGNHDLWLAAWLAGEGFHPSVAWPSMGAAPTIESYRTFVSQQPGRALPAHHRDLLLDAPVAAQLTVAGQSFWLTHSGVPPRSDNPALPQRAAGDPTGFIWHFTEPRDQPAMDHPVIMGHRPQPEPMDLGHLLAIDTGCGRWPGAPLTALLLPERRFLTVSVP